MLLAEPEIHVAGPLPREPEHDPLPLWPSTALSERLLAFATAVGFALLFIAIALAVRFVLGRTPLPKGPLGMLIGEFTAAACALLATFLMAKIEDRDPLSYGFRDARAFPRFLGGAATGFLSLTVMLLSLRLAGHFYFGSPAIHGGQILYFALLYLVLFFFVGLFEESVLRGYPLFKLSQAMGFWPATILLALLFARMHLGNSGESRFGLVSTGLFALVISYSILRSGSLWWAIGFHAIWDYSQSFIYGVPDSGLLLPGHFLNSSFTGPDWITGGSVGPEGSYLIVIVLAAVILVIHFSLRRQLAISEAGDCVEKNSSL
jgi:membrane protease YdiL (CAAX protease family)